MMDSISSPQPTRMANRSIERGISSGQANASPRAAEAGQVVQGASREQIEAAPRNKPAITPLADISLKFEIDAETNDITILILDRASQQVVRTIPPEEMAEMDPGELLQLFV